jgi:hypothetical protein
LAGEPAGAVTPDLYGWPATFPVAVSTATPVGILTACAEAMLPPLFCLAADVASILVTKPVGVAVMFLGVLEAHPAPLNISSRAKARGVIFFVILSIIVSAKGISKGIYTSIP